MSARARMPTLLRFIEHALLQRRPSVPQRALLAVLRLMRPGVLATRETLRRHLSDRVRVSVRAYNDDDPDQYRRLTYGDWWMRHGLVVALGDAGYVVTDVDPDVVIHLHGQPRPLPKRAIKILWIHDNPEKATPERLALYDHVFCASEILAARLRSRGIGATPLGLATSLRPRVVAPRYQVVFVGNARLDGHRPVVDALGGGFDLKVWGSRFGSLPEGVLVGRYVEYQDLPEVYGASAIALNDHYPSMADEGIVSPRVYDILASGGFCISDANPGLAPIFGDAVPQYRSPEELKALVRYFIDHPEERRRLAAAGEKIALGATWPDRARSLMAPLGEAFAPGGGGAAS